MSEANKEAVLSVLEDTCLKTEEGKAPGNAKLVWMTAGEVAKAGGMSVDDAQDGLDEGVEQGLVLKGTGEHKGTYALNDPDLDQRYTD